MDGLDVCTVGLVDSDAGESSRHVSARAVDHEIMSGASGVGDGDGSGGSATYVRWRWDYVGRR